MALLRDKFALKHHLRQAQPSLDVGFSRLLARHPGGAIPLGAELPERYVLKPNNGFGNRGVGCFTRSTPPQVIEAFLRAAPEAGIVLEEFIPGPEYFVNGQVDHQGASLAVAVFAYERVWANGAQVDWLTRKVHRSAPEFDRLEEYAGKVVAALGLRRSPFHLEAKLSGSSPRLVEFGARLAGNGNALLCEELHGGKLDLFGLAADHYLYDGPQPKAFLDFAAYDAQEILRARRLRRARPRAQAGRAGARGAAFALPALVPQAARRAAALSHHRSVRRALGLHPARAGGEARCGSRGRR